MANWRLIHNVSTVESLSSGPLKCGHLLLPGSILMLTWRSCPTKEGKGCHKIGNGRHTLYTYRIAGNFEGENFHESVKYKISWRKLPRIHHRPDIMGNKPKQATPIFVEKTFTDGIGSAKFIKFSRSKVSRYTVCTVKSDYYSRAEISKLQASFGPILPR